MVMAVAAAVRATAGAATMALPVVASVVVVSTAITAAESRLEGARCRRWLKARVPRGSTGGDHGGKMLRRRQPVPDDAYHQSAEC